MKLKQAVRELHEATKYAMAVAENEDGTEDIYDELCVIEDNILNIILDIMSMTEDSEDD